MCGIAGEIGNKVQSSYDFIKPMTRVMTHRGPDSEGYYVNQYCNMGMRRLSILDLKTGNQPMSNEDGSVVTIFNGEIYNHIQLRKELHNHTFTTLSDTEVIVHAYEQWGIEFVKKLDGMFALALWDDKNKMLIVCRDRIGKKPLYYYFDGKLLLFGSEIKAILQHPAYKKVANVAAIYHYLTYQYVPEPLTAFHSIYALMPARYMIYKPEIENAALVINQYWDFNLPRSEPENTREIVMAATRKRLMCDVPLGVYLSGGIDSTIVTGCMRSILGNAGEIHTFSVGFDDEAYNELPYAE